jgi:carbamoyltransferase
MNEIDEKLKKISSNVFYSTHHEAHLYYSFYTSSFDESICLSVDGVGEIDTLSMGIGTYHGIKYQTLAKYPHSLGLYYSAMTSYLGFKPNEGEYKMMGLAPYGDHKKYIKEARELINFNNNILTCNMDVFCWDRSNKSMFNEKLAILLPVPQRLPEEPIKQEHKDLAASIQKVYEEVFFNICKSIKSINKNTRSRSENG